MPGESAELQGAKLWEKWHCDFPWEELAREGAGRINMQPEPRIKELSRRMRLEGARVLELGSLEGYHSFMLQSLGAREVVAVEGRKENFLKCLVVKNAFGLDRCRFLYADVLEALEAMQGPFDLCLCLGILYHLEDPVAALYEISRLCNAVFVWSHYATAEFPPAPLSQRAHGDTRYRGKFVKEDTAFYTSGLHTRSFWLLQEDLFALVREAGFCTIDVIGQEQHEHGPAVTFLAKK